MNSEAYLNPELKIGRVEGIVLANPEVAGLQAYEYFRNNGNSQKQAFIAGADLNLDYPDLTVDAIAAIGEPARDALETLFMGDTNPKSEALFNAVEYRYSELFMLAMAKDMLDPMLDPEARTEARQWFMDANEGLYGRPDKQVFDALAKKHITSRLGKLPEDFAASRRLQVELQDALGPVDDTEFITFVPDTELVGRIGGLVHERFDNVVSHVDESKTYDVHGMVDVLDKTLTKLGGKELGWITKIVPNSSALAVAAHKKQVEVGEDRIDIQGDELKRKNIHEVGIHALRSMNAERAGWISAAYGQDGYLDFEESLATALEDAYQGKFADHGENYYLIAALAYGLDNHAPRNFREVYEIMWRMNALKAAKGAQDVSEEQMTKAQGTAFTSCMRLFRGTDTQTRGVVYLKDLAYFKGQELAWQALKDVQTQDDFELLFAGKLDVTRKDHRAIAEDILATNRS